MGSNPTLSAKDNAQPFSWAFPHARDYGTRLIATSSYQRVMGVNFATERFGVTDPVVLEAIRCHSTLRPKATSCDKVLFVADKLTWDPADAPYRQRMEAALQRSLDDAVHCFLLWSWERRQRMPVVHPWFRAACTEYFETQTSETQG